jgi:hypothetical protein
LALEYRRTLELNKSIGFSLIEQSRDPRRLFAAGAQKIEAARRSKELHEQSTENAKFVAEILTDEEGLCSDAPPVSDEESVSRNLIANESAAR